MPAPRPSSRRRHLLQGAATIGFTGIAGWPRAAFAASRPVGANAVEVVHAFDDAAGDGMLAVGDLTLDPDGVIHGVQSRGGVGGLGTIYRCSPADGAFTVLSHFGDGEDEPGAPECGLVPGSDGRLWGTSFSGGHQFQGTVYASTRHGTVELQAQFADEHVGDSVFGGVIEALPGRFFGTTNSTVYRLDARPGHDHGLKALHRFDGATDGDTSTASLCRGTDGLLYGCTLVDGPKGQGTLFRVGTDGSGFAVLKAFDGGNDGGNPTTALCLGHDGFLYGCAGGGRHGEGVAFRLGTDGSYDVLHAFAGGRHDGATPAGRLCQGPDGALYGCTHAGGAEGGGLGTVFRLTRRGGLSLLHRFRGDDPAGFDPRGGLTFGPDGKLYGTTRSGAAHGFGALFRLRARQAPLSSSP